MASTLEYKELKGHWAEYLQLRLTNVFRSGFISCNDCILPENFKSFGDRIQQLDVRDDDIWLCSFPKSGLLVELSKILCPFYLAHTDRPSLFALTSLLKDSNKYSEKNKKSGSSIE